MPNLIQIKRSLNTANATSLANGEMAFTSNGDVLWIGANGSVISIAGRRYPGVLTANQALVANSTSGIDKIIVANASIQKIWANGTHGTAGFLLSTDSGGNTYWINPSTLTTAAAGANTQVQFNNSTAFGGSAGFTFNKDANNLSVANNILVGNTVNALAVTVGSLVVANQSGVFTTGTVNGSVVSVGSLIIANTTQLTTTVPVIFGANNFLGTTSADRIDTRGVFSNNVIPLSNNVLTFGNSTFRWVIWGSNGTFSDTVVAGAGAITANSTRLTLTQTTGISANGSVGTANQALISNGTSVYWANVVMAVTAGNGVSGGGATGGTLQIDVGAGNGITVGTDTVAVNANNGIIANSTGTFAAPANGISVTASGINVVGGDGLVSNATGVHVVAGNGISVAADSVYVNPGSTLTVNSTGVHVNSALSITDLTLAGNLTVLGTLSTIDTTNLIIEDSMIELANGNVTTDVVDIGFFGQYGATGTKYAGLFRDASDSGIFKLFSGLDPKPLNNVDTANLSFTQATLQAYVRSGGLITNATHVAITANSTVNVAIIANTLTLSTALAATSGGTGQNTYASGDLLVGNTSNILSKLTLGADGKVLQSNGTALVYNDLDGGTF